LILTELANPGELCFPSPDIPDFPPNAPKHFSLYPFTNPLFIPQKSRKSLYRFLHNHPINVTLEAL